MDRKLFGWILVVCLLSSGLTLRAWAAEPEGQEIRVTSSDQFDAILGMTIPTVKAVGEKTEETRLMKAEILAPDSQISDPVFQWSVEGNPGVTIDAGGAVTVSNEATDDPVTVTAACGALRGSATFEMYRAVDRRYSFLEICKDGEPIQEDRLVRPREGSSTVQYTVKTYDDYGAEIAPPSGRAVWSIGYGEHISVEDGALTISDQTEPLDGSMCYFLTAELGGKKDRVSIRVSEPLEERPLKVEIEGWQYQQEPQRPRYDIPPDASGLKVTYQGEDGADYGETPPTRPGNYQVTVSYRADQAIYQGSGRFSISRRDISGPGWVALLNSREVRYDGRKKTPSVGVVSWDDGQRYIRLDPRTDYSVTCPEDIIDAGEYVVTIRGEGDYTGQIEEVFTIAPKPIGPVELTWSGGPFRYDGTVHEVSCSGLPDGVRAEVTGDRGSFAGDYTAVAVLSSEDPNYTVRDREHTYRWSIGPGEQELAYPSSIALIRGGNVLDLAALVEGARGEVFFSTTGTVVDLEDGVLTSGDAQGETVVQFSVPAVDLGGDSTPEYLTYLGAIKVSVVGKKRETLAVSMEDWTSGQAASRPQFHAPAGAETVIRYGKSALVPTEPGTYVVTVICETRDTIYTGNTEFTIHPPQPEPGPVPELEPQPGPVPEPQPEPDPAPEPQPQPGPALEPEPQPRPDAPSASVSPDRSWSREVDRALRSHQGSGILQVSLGRDSELSGQVLRALAERGVTLEVTVDDRLTWRIPAGKLPQRPEPLDLAVRLDSGAVPAAVLERLPPVKDAVQLSIDQPGRWQLSAALTVRLGQRHAGQWANRYRYDGAAQTLVFVDAHPIQRLGSVELPVDQGGDYVLLLDRIGHTAPFVDVEEGAWYSEAAAQMYRAGLMRGTGEGVFAPEQRVDRGMLVTILWRMGGSPLAATVGGRTDVERDSYYAKAVDWALETGIASGYGKGVFAPEQALTREQLAVMLHGYAGHPAPPDEELEHLDRAEIAPWAEDAMRWVVDQGILSGRSEGRLDPKGAVSRAETAQILMRYLQIGD